ncbi:hypothetical protein B7463_g7209, partial [Scytalidium lignicola]
MPPDKQPAIAPTINRVKPTLCFDYVDEPINVEVKASPIDGQGLFSTRYIEMGEVILSEAAFVIKAMPIEPATAKSFKKLVPEIANCASAAYYDLWTPHESDTRKSLYDRFNSNCFQISGDITMAEKGLFYVAARINHSHTPNAKWKYDYETNRLVIIALGDIRKGSEIVISYCCTSRDTRMLGYYSFKCQCPFCVMWVHPEQDAYGPDWRGHPHQDCGRCTACKRNVTRRPVIAESSKKTEKMEETEMKQVNVAIERRETRSSAREKEKEMRKYLLEKEKEDKEDDLGDSDEEYEYEYDDEDDWEDSDEDEDDSIGSAAEAHYFH